MQSAVASGCPRGKSGIQTELQSSTREMACPNPCLHLKQSLKLHIYDKPSAWCAAPCGWVSMQTGLFLQCCSLCLTGCLSSGMGANGLCLTAPFFSQVPWHSWQQLKDHNYGYRIAKGCLRMPAHSGGINISQLSMGFAFFEQPWISDSFLNL